MGEIKLTQILIAAKNPEASAAFYTAVCGAELAPVEQYGATFYKGTLCGGNFALAPWDLTGHEGGRNHLQLTFEVEDLEKTIEAGLASGGSLIEGNEKGGLRDPDGFTIGLVQRAG